MNKPNFQAMTKKELRTYVLAHRDDQDAFHAFTDRLSAQPGRILHPPLNSPEDMENYPDIIQKVQNDPGKQTWFILE